MESSWTVWAIAGVGWKEFGPSSQTKPASVLLEITFPPVTEFFSNRRVFGLVFDRWKAKQEPVTPLPITRQSCGLDCSREVGLQYVRWGCSVNDVVVAARRRTYS